MYIRTKEKRNYPCSNCYEFQQRRRELSVATRTLLSSLVNPITNASCILHLTEQKHTTHIMQAQCKPIAMQSPNRQSCIMTFTFKK